MIVYTAIIGTKRDALRPVVAPADDKGRPVEYVCFTDMHASAAPSGWQLRPPLWQHADPRRSARWHKIMGHTSLGDSNKHSLWIDGTVQLLVNPWELVDRYLTDRDIAVFRHHERVCVYQELEMCLRLGYDDPDVMRRQVERYREEGYPPRRGLWEMGAFLRSHTPAIQQFNQLWWREVEYGSVRDQLSVNYAAWKLSLPPAYMAGNIFTNPYFNFTRHKT